jgi:hypothetical protein
LDQGDRERRLLKALIGTTAELLSVVYPTYESVVNINALRRAWAVTLLVASVTLK